VRVLIAVLSMSVVLLMCRQLIWASATASGEATIVKAPNIHRPALWPGMLSGSPLKNRVRPDLLAVLPQPTAASRRKRGPPPCANLSQLLPKVPAVHPLMNDSNGSSQVYTRCFGSWVAEEPMFPSIAANGSWHEAGFRRKPLAFTDCVGRSTFPGGCEWPRGCANVQVGREVWLRHAEAGSCGMSPSRTVPMHAPAPGQACDPRTFIPLDVIEGAYLPHFLDQISGKLAMLLELSAIPAAACAVGAEPLLVYAPRDFAGDDTAEVLRMIGAELTHVWPEERCFHRVIWGCDGPPFHRALQRRARNLFRLPRGASLPTSNSGNNLYPNSPVRCTARVYMSRQRSTRNGRLLTNERAIMTHLTSASSTHGGTPFRALLGDEPLAEKLLLVSDACLLVGPHGGALYFMHWMPEGTAVVELDGYNMYKVFWALAAAYGLIYAFVHFTPADGVDVRALDDVLGRVEARMAEIKS